MRGRNIGNGVVLVKDKVMTMVAKVIDGWIIREVSKEIKRKVIRWKVRMSVWYKWRFKFMRWRQERWIPGILSECDIWNVDEWYENENVVYVYMNLRNRKRYIGETKQMLRARMSGHMKECKGKLNRCKVRAMNNLGLELWVVLPMKKVVENWDRKMEELRLIHKWKDVVINDRFTYSSRKVDWNLDEGEQERKWRMDIIRVLDDENNMRRCTQGELWALVEKERRYRLTGRKKREFENKVVGLLGKLDRRVRKEYLVKVPWGDYNEKKVMKIVRKDLRRSLGSNIGRLIEET